MRNPIHWIFALVLFALVALGVVSWQTSKVKQELQTAIEKGIRVGTVTITWTSGGMPVVFTSTHEPGETPEAWAARARAEYLAMLAVFPKDT